MRVFAPVYNATGEQQTSSTKEHKRGRKRKRGRESSVESEDERTQQSPATEWTPRPLRTTSRPLNQTDPYHVAGYNREDSLPPPPFPHAAARPGPVQSRTVHQELAELHPPVSSTRASYGYQETSLKKRHADNLTAILHSCVLKGDWQRASRAWGLLVRTEIAGRGIDVRQNGRWGLGAELLMRRGLESRNPHQRYRVSGDHDVSSFSATSGQPALRPYDFSDKGFSLAREFYERLILQYPHTPRTQHSINAVAFYPELFNIWIYEVRYRSKCSRHTREVGRSMASARSQNPDIPSSPVSSRSEVLSFREEELKEVEQIAKRMDEVMLGPPYDASMPLLRLRGMLALALSDLYSHSEGDTTGDETELSGLKVTRGFDQRHENQLAERRKALQLLKRVKEAGEALPSSIVELLE